MISRTRPIAACLRKARSHRLIQTESETQLKFIVAVVNPCRDNPSAMAAR